MTNEMAEGDAQRPVLNVVSTVRTATSSPLKWQIQNFGLFLTSKVKELHQHFDPMPNIQLHVSLSKNKSGCNENDKLELIVRPHQLSVYESTAQLKGRIWLNDGDEWASEFVFNFNDTIQHFFATPASSFNSASVLTIGDMIFEHVVVDTEVMSSWIMRLDDSCIMSRSALELNRTKEMAEWDYCPEEEEKQSVVSSNIEILEPETSNQIEHILHLENSVAELDVYLEPPKSSFAQTNKIEISSTDTEPSENLDVLSAVSEFTDSLPDTPVKVDSAETNTTPLTLQSLQQIDRQVDSLLEKLRSRPLLECCYQKKYQNLDDEWLKSLDELLVQTVPDHDVRTLRMEILDLKQAHRDLYRKLRKQFQLFGSDFLLFEFPSDIEKQNLDELYVLIDYFEAVLKKLTRYQAEFDEFNSLDDEYWPLDEFPDCSQETKWIDDYKKVRGTNEEESFMAQEIRNHSNLSAKLERIQQELKQLWSGYERFSKSIYDQKLKWSKESQFLIERMRIDIGECEQQSLELFIRPMSVEEFGEMRCKLAQLQSNIAEMLKKQEDDDSVEHYFAELDLADLDEKMKVLRQTLSLPNQPKIAATPTLQLEKIKEKMKDLDKRVVKPSQRLKLDSIKDCYDSLCAHVAHFKALSDGPSDRFNKAVNSVNQLHSNFSYTMEAADSETLINYEVELCKCLAELETVITTIEGDNLSGAPFWRQHYDAAKWKTDWVAQRLRERLEPWRQFMDLYTNIEQSHKAVGELVTALAVKPDNGYHETCQDIDVLESVNITFETTRKDIVYIRQLCSAGHMKSTGLAAEATRFLQRIDQAHRLVENGLRSLMLKLKAKTVNPFYGRGRRGHRRNRNGGGSSYDPYY